jgi:hypothetical protein
VTYQLTSAAIGLLVGLLILWLVRRDHLHGPYAVWWIGAAATVVFLGCWPQVFDLVAGYLGISYPPILAVVLGFLLLLLKVLTMDLERSRQQRAIRRLAQRLAILDGQVHAGCPPAAEDDGIVARTHEPRKSAP